MASSVPSTIPEIDIAPFIRKDSTEEEKKAVVKEVSNACKGIGFFIIKGHGISTETVDNTSLAVRKFFDLPSEEKNKNHIPGSGSGYLPMGMENLAATYKKDGPSDLKECYNINSRSEKNSWPNLPEFKTICMNYFVQMDELASVIMQIFALGLKLPANYFEKFIKPTNALLRFANYPPLESEPLPQQMRAAEHTDYGTLTIVRPDAPGLQARNRNDDWIDVDAPPGSFVVNIGDAMQRWTNKKWISTVHRVINPIDDYKSRRESIVFFHNPCDDALIECLDTCHSEKYPILDKPIEAGELRKEKSHKSRQAV